MNYPETFREKMVLRMSEPGGISANALSEEVGVSQTSLSKWLRDAAGVEPVAKKVNGKSIKAKVGKRPQDWTAAEKLEAVLESASLSEQEKTTKASWLQAVCQSHAAQVYGRDNALRKQNRGAPRLRVHALQDARKKRSRLGPASCVLQERCGPSRRLCRASRFHFLMEYGGLARTTSSVLSQRLRSIRAGSCSVHCRLRMRSRRLHAARGFMRAMAVVILISSCPRKGQWCARGVLGPSCPKTQTNSRPARQGSFRIRGCVPVIRLEAVRHSIRDYLTSVPGTMPSSPTYCFKASRRFLRARTYSPLSNGARKSRRFRDLSVCQLLHGGGALSSATKLQQSLFVAGSYRYLRGP